MIPLLGKPGSSICLKLNGITLNINYNGKGLIKTMRQKRVKGEPVPEGYELKVLSQYSVLMRRNAHFGYNFSIGFKNFDPSSSGFLNSGTVWNDDSGSSRSLLFQEWADKCALFLTNGFNHKVFKY